MTPAEIVRSYRQSDRPADQIRVLAELNACPIQTIVDALLAQGEKLPKGYRVPREKRLPASAILFDETRAKALHQEGKCDLDIAEMLGVPKTAVVKWRKSRDLAANSPLKGRPQRPRKRPGAQPPMPPEVEMGASTPAAPEAQPSGVPRNAGHTPSAAPSSGIPVAYLARMFAVMAEICPAALVRVDGLPARTLNITGGADGVPLMADILSGTGRRADETG